MLNGSITRPSTISTMMAASRDETFQATSFSEWSWEWKGSPLGSCTTPDRSKASAHQFPSLARRSADGERSAGTHMAVLGPPVRWR